MHRHDDQHAYEPQFKHDDFQFGLEIALGACQRGAADVGEVLVTAARIKDGDADAWVREWTATADAVEAAGREAAGAGRRASAVAYLRRAATYHATALYLIDGSHQNEDKLARWRRQRACWEQVVDLSGGERVAIPYDGTTMPGFFFRAPDAAPGESRPLVVLNNGSDGAASQMWVQGGAAASERGYHWMTFDGPGQQAMLFEHGVPFRPDWESVLTPVLDAMTAREDVDADRIALIGISQAGFWVPRTLAFEHRFAAAVADPGVVDVSTSWIEPLPKSMRKLLEEGKQEQFDRDMRLGERFSRSTAVLLKFRGEPYGLDDDSPLRALPGGDALPARRRGRADRHTAAHHRPGGRAVLAGPVAAVVRSPSRSEAARPLHRGRGRKPSLRTDGRRAPRRAHLRLARRVPGPRDLSRRPFAGTTISASDGTRTRDLRRDRPRPAQHVPESHGARDHRRLLPPL